MIDVKNMMTIGHHILYNMAVSPLDGPDVAFRISQDEFLALPESVQEQCVGRHQLSPTSAPKFDVPRRILARYAVGLEE